MRIAGLPWTADSVGRLPAPDLGGIRSAHVGQLLCVRATVLRASAVQMLETQRTYACKKCKHRCGLADRLHSCSGGMHRPHACYFQRLILLWHDQWQNSAQVLCEGRLRVANPAAPTGVPHGKRERLQG